MLIGPHQLAPFKEGMPILTLAPMAGVGNWVFRLICARLGARLVGAQERRVGQLFSSRLPPAL